MSFTGAGEVASLIETTINKIWPDKSAADAAQLAAAVAIVQGQLDTNKAEAANPNLFTSGWRPAIGWVCGAACAWNWIGLSIANFAMAALGHPTHFSLADTSEILPLLFGMLGLGSLRTIEKIKGVAS